MHNILSNFSTNWSWIFAIAVSIHSCIYLRSMSWNEKIIYIFSSIYMLPSAKGGFLKNLINTTLQFDFLVKFFLIVLHTYLFYYFAYVFTEMFVSSFSSKTTQKIIFFTLSMLYLVSFVLQVKIIKETNYFESNTAQK